MIQLDASGLISLLAGQPAAEQVAGLLREGGVVIASVNLAEVLDQMQRVEGYPRQELEDVLDGLIDAGLVVAAVDHADGRLAGHIRAAEYERRMAPLAMADCVVLACALNRAAQLATADVLLARVARKRNVAVVALPNSAGRLP